MPRWTPFDPATDRRLVQGLNEDDVGSLGELYDAYAEPLYDYVLSVTGDFKAAAALVHDSFIDAGRRAPRMRDHLLLRAWLYGAARRRVVQRGRAREPYWDPDAEFSPAPLDRAESPPPGDLRELLQGAMACLEVADQEVLLLGWRHGLRPDELGKTFGLSPRRAAARVAEARKAMDAALAKELAVAAGRCAAGLRRPHETNATGTADTFGPVRVSAKSVRGVGGLPRRTVAVLTARRPAVKRPASPEDDRAMEVSPLGDEDLGRHRAGCPACRARAEVPAEVLLTLAPAPVLPAALRHRVMHTASDPELAGYRADIAARGGTLTPEGTPVQPDVPSPFTRRWLFAGGGMAGALVTALVAALFMGSGLDTSTLYWLPGQKPQPAISTLPSPDAIGPGRDPQNPQGPQAQGPGGPRGGTPPLDPHLGEQSPGDPRQPGQPGTSPGPSSPPTQPVKPGVLVVAPAKVELYGTKTGQLQLKAESGPVDWKVASSTDQLTVSRNEGDLSKNATGEVTVTLRAGLLKLPGKGTLTFTDAAGAVRQIEVVWGVSLL